MLYGIVLLAAFVAFVRSDDYKQLRIPDFPEPLQGMPAGDTPYIRDPVRSGDERNLRLL